MVAWFIHGRWWTNRQSAIEFIDEKNSYGGTMVDRRSGIEATRTLEEASQISMECRTNQGYKDGSL